MHGRVMAKVALLTPDLPVDHEVVRVLLAVYRSCSMPLAVG
jgi:hypothetical protein